MRNKVFKVTASGGKNRDGRQGSALEAFSRNRHRAGQGLICNGDCFAIGQINCHGPLRSTGQGYGIGNRCTFCNDLLPCQGRRGDVTVVHNGGRGTGTNDAQIFVVAIGRRTNAVDRSGDGGCTLQVVFVRTAANRDVGKQTACCNRDRLRNAANRDVECECRLRRIVNAEAEGELVAFDHIVHVAFHDTDADLGRRGVNGVVDDCNDVGVVHGDRGEVAALHRAHAGLQGFAVFKDVIALHRHQHSANGRSRRDNDDGTIAQGDGHV